MRRTLLAVLVLVSVPAFAQDRTRRVSLFLTDPGLGYSEGGGSSGFVAGMGVAFEQYLGRRWSVELAATREQREAELLFIDFSSRSVEIDATPIDLTASYHIRLPPLRWRPYVGAGARWVKAPDEVVTDLEDRVSPQVVVGLDYNATPAWSLRIDAKRLLHDDDQPHDPLLKVAIGAGYRF